MMGTIREYMGQRYWVADTFMHARKNGSLAVVLVWASHCAECGEEFRCSTPAAAKKWQPNRRCQKHKRPGCRVKGSGK